MGLRAVLGVGGEKGHRRGGTEIKDNVLLVDCDFDDLKKKLRIVPVDSTTEFDMKKHVQQWINNATPANSLEKAPGTPFYVRDLPILEEHSQVRVISPTGLVDTGIMFPVTGTTQTQGILYINGNDESSIRYGLIYDPIDMFKRLGVPENIARQSLYTASGNIQKAYERMQNLVQQYNTNIKTEITRRCIDDGFPQNTVNTAVDDMSGLLLSMYMILDSDTLKNLVMDTLRPPSDTKVPLNISSAPASTSVEWPVCSTGRYWTGEIMDIPGNDNPKQSGFLFADAVQWVPQMDRPPIIRIKSDGTEAHETVTCRYFHPVSDVKTPGDHDSYRTRFFNGIRWEAEQLQNKPEFFTTKSYISDHNALVPFNNIIPEIRRFRLSQQVLACSEHKENKEVWIAQAKGDGACFYNSVLPQILHHIWEDTELCTKCLANITSEEANIRQALEQYKKFNPILAADDGTSHSELLFSIMQPSLSTDLQNMLHAYTDSLTYLRYIQNDGKEAFKSLIIGLKTINFFKHVITQVDSPAISYDGEPEHVVLQNSATQMTDNPYRYTLADAKSVLGRDPQEQDVNRARFTLGNSEYICTSTNPYIITHVPFYNYAEFTQIHNNTSLVNEFAVTICGSINTDPSRTAVSEENHILITDTPSNVILQVPLNNLRHHLMKGPDVAFWDVLSEINMAVEYNKAIAAEIKPDSNATKLPTYPSAETLAHSSDMSIAAIDRLHAELFPHEKESQPSGHAPNLADLFNITIGMLELGLCPFNVQHTPITTYEPFTKVRQKYATLIEATHSTNTPVCFVTQTGEGHFDMVFLKSRVTDDPVI